MTTALATYVLTFDQLSRPGCPPLTLNEFKRAHWTKQRRATHEVHYRTRKALQGTPVPALDRVRVTITQYAPNARRRDADGLGAFAKDAIDALVKERILTDDNSKIVASTTYAIEVDRSNPRITLTLHTF